MSARLLRVAVVSAVVITFIGLTWTTAAAQGGGGEFGGTKVKTKSGSITISSRYVRWAIGRASGNIGTSSDQGGPAPVCLYFSAGPVATQHLGKGGAEPGAWYIPICKFPNHVYGNPMPAVWLVRPPPPLPAVNPSVVARQAVSTLALAGPRIGMSPPPNRPQIVHISTWLWISGAWRGRSATATAGPVSATAKAVPYKVVWNMGDGHKITCLGPGTKYDPTRAASAQSTNCSYTYSKPSSTAPGGRFTVTATIYYRVTWVARGAPGGGNLGLIAGPTAQTTVLVEQAEALNTSSGG